MLTFIAIVTGAVVIAALLAWFARPPPADPDPREAPRSRPPPGAERAARAPLSRRSAPLAPPVDEEEGVVVDERQSGEVSLTQSVEVIVDDLEDDAEGPPRIQLRSAHRTDPGRRRKHNEDRVYAGEAQALFVVADGMGGYAAGEVAAERAVEALKRAHERGSFGALDAELPGYGAQLVWSIRHANDLIREEAEADVRKDGMGTTIVAARVDRHRQRIYIAHVGDSRCYRLREGQLEQLTKDHTLAELGLTGPGAGKLSRAVGVFKNIDVDLRVEEPRPGDRYLLCSDGLYKMMEDDEIRGILRRSGASMDDVVDEMIALSNERGGRDNVTVVVIAIDPGEPAHGRGSDEAD